MEQKNVKVARRMELNDYITIFNFISKVAYYTTNGSSNPLGSLRKECCSEMIEYDENIDRIKKSIDGKYKLKFINMYTNKINDKYALSILNTTTVPETPNEISPIVYSNDIIFDDDLKHIYALVDYRLFSSKASISCADYIESVFNCVISEMTDLSLVEDEANEYMIKNSPWMMEQLGGIKRLAMRNLNILLSNILYEDSEKYKDEEELMKVTIRYVDQIMKSCMYNNVEYAAFSTLALEEIRKQCTDYIYELNEN